MPIMPTILDHQGRNVYIMIWEELRMSIINLFRSKEDETLAAAIPLAPLLKDFSIEVMPRTAEKVEDFQGILPARTRVYIAHLEGTPFEDMLKTAKRLSADGFAVMPHFPARIIENRATLEEWIRRYQDEAGVEQALVLAGGVSTPAGEFSDSMQLLETGLFDKHGFKRLHVAGHPEGNPDIDEKGVTTNVDSALRWKQEFSTRTDAEMAIATQFAFAAQPVIDWAERIRAAGITLPVHVGVAGPAKLQTLIKFAIACGVGPSLKVLQKRAKDVTKLVQPYEPTEVLSDLATYVQQNPDGPIQGVHIFPLGGIGKSAEYAGEHGEHDAAQAATS